MLRIQNIIVDGLRTINFNCATLYLHVLATYIAGTCPSPAISRCPKPGVPVNHPFSFRIFHCKPFFLGGFPICGNFHRATRTYRSWISIPGRFTASFRTPNRWPDTFPDGKKWVLGGRPLVNLLRTCQRSKIYDMYVVYVGMMVVRCCTYGNVM